MYNQKFFENQQQGSLNSAKVVVPLVLELVPAKSVIDIGCGTGTWLSQFVENGVTDITGVDGSWVKEEMLRIPTENFIKADLTQPLNVSRKFDLAMSLEVAEHLDEKYADTFVESLVNLAPVILFSAAIPHQGGNHHVNEQWPEYWITKFENRGYRTFDIMRKELWDNNNVQWWYSQNVLLFVSSEKAGDYKNIFEKEKSASLYALPLVHPKNFHYGNSVTQLLLEILYKIFDKIKFIGK